MNRIEGGVGVLERPLYDKKLDSKDPAVIMGEYHDLLQEAGGHGIKAFNNFENRFNYIDPKNGKNWRFMTADWDPDFDKEYTTKHGEKRQPDGHSDFFLSKTPKEFYEDFDRAAKKFKLDPQVEIGDVMAKGTDDIYKNPKIKQAYIHLRTMGYNHFDLAS